MPDYKKKWLDKNVHEAAIERLEFVFDNFEKVYFSFSGGKDSGVMVHLAKEIAKRKNKLPINVIYIDFEAQYRETIKYIEKILLSDNINAYWICLPMNLRNSISSIQPFWMCWDPDTRGKWVREMPKYDCVISDPDYFPFFRKGMEFEEFVVEFGKWFSEDGKKQTACGVAIRAQESINRFRTLKNEKKSRFQNKFWTTEIENNLYNFYPIYDWKTEDIWTAYGKFGWEYNRVYDYMYMAGKSIHESRLCQPFGDDQRIGLDLFKRIEPDTWVKLLDRVSGVNFGNIYCGTFALGHKKIYKPDRFKTWKEYVEFVLSTLPKYEQVWYERKLKVFFNWWSRHGYPTDKIPDEADPKLEAEKKVPSWRRVAKCLLKNDKLCKSLSFGQTIGQYDKYMQLKEEYGE